MTPITTGGHEQPEGQPQDQHPRDPVGHTARSHRFRNRPRALPRVTGLMRPPTGQNRARRAPAHPRRQAAQPRPQRLPQRHRFPAQRPIYNPRVTGRGSAAAAEPVSVKSGGACGYGTYDKPGARPRTPRGSAVRTSAGPGTLEPSTTTTERLGPSDTPSGGPTESPRLHRACPSDHHQRPPAPYGVRSHEIPGGRPFRGAPEMQKCPATEGGALLIVLGAELNTE